MSFLKKFSEPFPDKAEPVKNISSLAGVGLFVAAFLYFLRPFGISGVENQLIWVCLGFGGVTLLFGFLFDLFCFHIIGIRTDIPSWTLGKWIVQSILLLVWIALGNYWFLVWLSQGKWDAYSLWNMLLYTFVVGLFPIVFSGLLIQLRALKKNQGTAEKIKRPAQKVIDHGSESLTLPISKEEELTLQEADVLMIEAMQNYLAVYYSNDNEVTRIVIRLTLSGFENLLVGNIVQRCHRSFMVNWKKVVEVKGNAQGLKLKIDGIETEVPVSRTYIDHFKALLG